MTLAMEIRHHVEMEKNNWLAEGRNEGRAEGLAEGRNEGRAEGRAEGALNLIQLGLSVEQIARATGIPVEQIKDFKNDAQKAR